jgi:hypothetical protein
MIRGTLPALLLAALAIPPAMAQADRPVTLPTRDVDVTYRAGQGDRVVSQRSRWSAAERKMRLDTPTPGVYAIVDYVAGTLAMVSERSGGVLDLPVPAGGLPGQAAPGGAFTRRGSSQVAGLPCTEWETRNLQGQATLTCFTDDGVLLEARHGAQVLVQATRVAYGALDPSAFAVPPSYAHETPRSAPPQAAPPGGSR